MRTTCEIDSELGFTCYRVSLVRLVPSKMDGRCYNFTRLFLRERFDLIHTHMSKAGVLGRIAASFTPSAIIVHTAHGWSLWDSPTGWVRHSVRITERCAAQLADMLFIVCEHDRLVGTQDIDSTRHCWQTVTRGYRSPRFPPRPPGPVIGGTWDFLRLGQLWAP